MQHLGAASGNRKPRLRLPAGSAELSDGWLSVEPQPRKNGKVRTRSGGPDALGLNNTVNPLTFLARKPNNPVADGRSGNIRNQQQTPRRRRLRTSGDNDTPVGDAFSPQKSLRLAKLPMLTTKERRTLPEIRAQANQSVTATPMQLRGAELPLHELIQTVDDAVKADPRAELNQSAIAHLFMDQWLRQFESNRCNYKSVAIRYEVGFEELQRRTVNLPLPNELITTFCCKVLEDLTPHFGPYAPLFRVLSAELIQSIYAHDGLPYFALVKHHKRLVQALRKDKEWREERNDVLADDIGNVYAMFRRFMYECTYALTRLLLHEWYSIAVVQKKNNRKYIEYFSNWFSNAPRALFRKVFIVWKREAALHRIDKIRKQTQIDLQGLTVVKRQADDLTQQRDAVQADNLVMRNDRKQAEEWARQLELRIKAASTYLDTTRRREAQICQEGQLRVEAVACLPPLILESLLRGYHGVGFLQHALIQEGQDDSSDEEMCDPLLQKNQAKGACSILQDCLAEIERLRSAAMRRKTSVIHGGGSNSVVAPTGRLNSVVLGSAPAEIGVQMSSAAALVAGSPIGRRVTGGALTQDELSGRMFSRFFSSFCEKIRAPDGKVLFTPRPQEDLVDKPQGQHNNAQMSREYQQLLRDFRAQDEHYASHSKLFSSRMLESHEISLVPTSSMPNETDGFAGIEKGELGFINGVKRFWLSNAAAKKPRTSPRKSELRRAPTRKQSVFTSKDSPQPQPVLLENLELFHESDFDLSPLHSRGFAILFLAHIATEYGSLLFSPADMSVFTHNAYLNPPTEKTKSLEDVQDLSSSLESDKKSRASEGKIPPMSTSSPTQHSLSLVSPKDAPVPEAQVAENVKTTPDTLALDNMKVMENSLRIIDPVVTAYNTWNQVSEQLISADVVESRGRGQNIVVAPSNEGTNGDLSKAQGTPLGTPIRPILQHQFEPPSHSSFLTPARDKPGRRLSFSNGEFNTYQAARIRHLAADGTERLIQSLQAIHKSVKATSAKMQDFKATHQQLRGLRGTQWQQASELASQFATKPKEVPGSPVAVDQIDHRNHVYECFSLTNGTMCRLFSAENNPEIELSLVRATFEKHQWIVRQLYTPLRANIKHVMSLDDLWHVVKILRLPREIHVLPVLRDEELVANGYEQLFSPEDLAELFLQLCNEQFQPQIASLSARVEYFVTHHLPIAIQSPSLLRPLMHRSDVKLAIHSHSQTIRIVFRRYCAKERELMAPASGTTKPKPRHTGHGITKYMRMVDWQAFVQDYRLVRPRFSMDQAMSVFRNVQESPPGSDDQLELIYSEFCEALVGMAAFFFPDPFLKPAAKVIQFFRRYLPLSPDDVHDA